MSVTEHDPESCDRCGIPNGRVCQCDCDHTEFTGSECDECGYECEHGDFDHGVCGFCGEDCLEDIMARAHEACEGDR